MTTENNLKPPFKIVVLEKIKEFVPETSNIIKILVFLCNYFFIPLSLIVAFMPFWMFTILPSSIAILIALYVKWICKTHHLPLPKTKRSIILAVLCVVLGFTLGLTIKAKLPNDTEFNKKIKTTQIDAQKDLNDAFGDDATDTTANKNVGNK